MMIIFRMKQVYKLRFSFRLFCIFFDYIYIYLFFFCMVFFHLMKYNTSSINCELRHSSHHWMLMESAVLKTENHRSRSRKFMVQFFRDIFLNYESLRFFAKTRSNNKKWGLIIYIYTYIYIYPCGTSISMTICQPTPLKINDFFTKKGTISKGNESSSNH